MEKNFAEKVTIKAGGAFRNFPRFACAHCTVVQMFRHSDVQMFRRSGV